MKRNKLASIICITLLTSSFSTFAQSSDDGINQVLSSSLNNKADKTASISDIRKNVLIEFASSYGVSSGLAWELNKIKNTQFVKNEARFDSLYDFSKLIIDNGVLPPVLEEGLSNYAQDSPNEVRTSDKTISIVSHAKFVSVYPTWRDYLIFNIPEFETPPKSYLPQNDAESALWDEWARKGWDGGVQQAKVMYQSALSRLDRDYNGMILFKILLAQGLITPTLISKHNLGVTGDGKEISINDQIFRIVDHSSLVPDTKEWKVQYPVTYKNGSVVK